jgi:hypothetical protein
MHPKKIARIAGAASIALCLGISFESSAQAHSAGPATGHKGTCSATSTVKLAVSGHKKGNKVTAQVKTDVANEAWDWSISDNGTTVANDESSTRKNDKLVVRQTLANLDGTDTVDFTATDSVTGETCTAEVTAR